MISKESLPNDVQETILRLCEDLATPRSLTVAILVRYKEWDLLANLRVDPALYNDADRLKSDLAASSFLRKCVDLPTTIDRKAEAVRLFWQSEKECCNTNIRLNDYLNGILTDAHDDHVYQFIMEAKKFLSKLLGRAPAIGSFDGKFGPGATYGDRGSETTVPHKMSSSPTFTQSAVFHLIPWISTKWASALISCNNDWTIPASVRGNRFTTVSKDCTKDRGIAIEPSINLFYQLGIGRILKDRLKRAGLNLAKGQELHRLVACVASINRLLATLDLSNASDTVCRNLVKLLLPPDWYELLSSLRSPTTLIDGKVVYLEKFSSMGNGFTFELETIIFLALAHTTLTLTGVTPHIGQNVLVYGDDIIVPTDSAKDVMAVLRFFGFTINATKSFASGNFRESCGGDFYEGVNVRPYFLKELPYEPQHYIAIANGLRAMGTSNHTRDYLDDRYRRSWFRVLDAIPTAIRGCRGPAILGDLVVHDSSERWSTRSRNCIRYFRVYRPHRFNLVRWSRFAGPVVLASALYGAGDGKTGVVPRGPALSFKVGWIAYS